MRRLFRFRLE
ncbi:hypothetical protein WJX84_005909 [Apatococcus fuscideae]|uniref:Uncharacterized protein n=1 Tax=Apatococcus fuscideae TaxID=2026836 RepID=A0AAW1TEL9_9CHLO